MNQIISTDYFWLNVTYYQYMFYLVYIIMESFNEQYICFG